MRDHIHNVKTIVETMGYKIIDPEWYDHIYDWYSWYQGKVDEFHKYQMFNGHKWVNRERFSLGMPKVMAEDWATLLFNDRTYIKVDEADQETIDDIFEKNGFEGRMAELIEIYMALGTGATVVYADNKNEPRINYVPAPMIFPLRTENKEIIDCAFVSVTDNEYYVNVHEKQKNGRYRITNRYWKFDTQGVPHEQKHSEVKDSYESDVKLFQIYKPGIVNNIDIFSPFGISFFANSIDRNKNVDLIYDSLRNEFQLGKKRIFIRGDLVDYKPVVNAKGETMTVPIFDDNDTEFYALPDDDVEGEQIKEVNSTLRVNDHIGGLQSALNVLSDGCGLGNDRYNFQEGRVYTNTSQVISTQSKLYKTLLKHEKNLRKALTDLVRSLMYIVNNSEYDKDVTIDFDDSIIEDSAEIQRRAMLELNNSIIDPVEYLCQVYKYTEEQAIEFYDKIKARNPQPEEEPEPE